MPKAKADPKARDPKPADAEGLFEAMYLGQSLRGYCTEHGIHAPSMSRMLLRDTELSARYVRAKETRGEYYGEHVETIARAVLAGKIKPDAARVAIDAYKWTAARMAPKQYGDKVDLNHGVQPENPLASLLSAIDGRTRGI